MVQNLVSNETYNALPAALQDAMKQQDYHRLLNLAQKHRIRLDDEIIAWVNNRAADDAPKGFTMKVERYLGRHRWIVAKTK